MIPPSLTLIVYGVTINESITKLFFAGDRAGPGSGGDVHGLCGDLFQDLVRLGTQPGTHMSFAEKLHNSRFLIPVLILITVVIGSMYLGYATATEAAAFGVIGGLLLAAWPGIAELEDLLRKPDGCHPHQRDDCADPGRCRVPVAVDGLHRFAARAWPI